MRRRVLALLGSAACLAAFSAPADAAPPADPLEYLKSISGSSTLSGQHNKEPLSDPTRWTQKVHDITGDHPGLWGGNFLFAESDVEQRQNLSTRRSTSGTTAPW